MLPVVTHAEPAELILALTARHMHASLIFLNWTLALWAWLRVQLHPVIRVVVSLADSICPSDQVIAVHRQVCILSALEAEGFVAFDTADIDLLGCLILHCEMTVTAWAPFGLVRQVYKGVGKQFSVASVLLLV